MSLAAEVRYAIRSLRRSTGFSVAVVVTLALGIGANVTMLGLVDRLMLSPPPHVGEPDRVVHVGISYGAAGQRFTVTTTSYLAFVEIRSQVPSLAAVAATAYGPLVFGTGGEARSIAGAKVSGNYFALLRVGPVAGRFFSDADDQAPSGLPVTVISQAFWRREFAEDPAVVGRTLLLNDRRYTVIGIAPADFNGDQIDPVDVWVPLHAGMDGQPNWLTERHLNVVALVARLRDGVPAERAAAEATLAFRRGNNQSAGFDSTATIQLRSLRPGKSFDGLSTQSRVALWLGAMSVIVFLVSLVNVTNLFLVRSVQRRREIAVRLALGAGRSSIVRQMLVESSLLAFGGGCLALALAGWGSNAVRAVLLPGISATSSILPLRMLEIAFVAIMFAVLITGLFPALRASRPSLVGDLKQGAGAIGHQRMRMLSVLLASQSALSVVLVAGSGLFIMSLANVRGQDLGFKAANVFVASMDFNQSVPGAIRDATYHEAEDQVRKIPGVVLTSLVQATPFTGQFNVPPISVPGRDDFPLPNKQIPALTVATSTYFRLLGMRLIAGRGFTESDGAASQLVVIINDAMARGLWPGQSAIGKCVRIGFGDEPPSGPVAPPSAPCREIIGVVNTARRRSIREETAEQARMQYYVPFGQLPKPPSFVVDHGEVWGLLVRTSGGAELPATIRRRMQSFAPNLPFTEVKSLQGLLDRQTQPWTLGATMFTLFGALVAVLSGIGLYSVRAYSVAQRDREMGVRMALGASSAGIARLVVREGLTIFGAGIAAGLLLTVAGGQLINPLLFDVTATNPLVLAVTALLLATVALLANALPAMRAARTPVSRALRAE